MKTTMMHDVADLDAARKLCDARNAEFYQFTPKLRKTMVYACVCGRYNLASDQHDVNSRQLIFCGVCNANVMMSAVED